MDLLRKVERSDVWELDPMSTCEHEDYPADWSEPTVKGTWTKEYKANKYHDCNGLDPYCQGEICPGEYYLRTAVLVRAQGERGTVVVTRKCLVCQ